MSAAMTSGGGGGHHHHSLHPSDLEVLDSLTNAPSTSTGRLNGGLNERRPSRRPLDTLQALRRPPIDPIVLAASLSSGPHVTRHHFLHSFGPKTESKQMTRSQRAQKEKEEEEEEARIQAEKEARQKASSSSLGTRPRAGSYANCDADDEISERARRANEISQSILEEIGEAQKYQSKQMPRSERLKMEKEAQEARERQKKEGVKLNGTTEEDKAPAKNVEQLKDQEARPKAVRLPSQQIDEELLQRKSVIEAKQRHSQQTQLQQQQLVINQQSTPIPETIPATPAFSSIVRPPPLTIRCYARTRIPTPHGEIFCHLYRNNRDQKEHLALVIDPAQNAADDRYAEAPGRFIRSKTLDEVWGPTETEMERIVRGAYVGRLGPTHQQASKQGMLSTKAASTDVEPPLVRIHSECYTGETIGSQRCDCGEQLDEAIRLIHADARPAKGVVVYLRQEGRGIGLLDKLMAYNLQDMGHDTVAANILLGHLADARKYDIAAEILRDLGVGSCRLLTNNPDKMEALEAEGISVNKRVAMVPRIWRMHSHPRRKLKHSNNKKSSRHKARKPKGLDASIVSQFDGGSTHATVTTDEDGDGEYHDDDEDDSFSDSSRDSYLEHHQRRAGATMIGASLTRGPELEKYLRTKVEKMGHLLDVPAEQAQAALEQSQISMHPTKDRKHRSRQRDTTDPSISKLDTSDGDTAGTDDEPLMDAAELQEYITSQSQSYDEEGEEKILINDQKEKN